MPKPTKARLAIQAGDVTQIDDETAHYFERREIVAINAALAAGRPLLIRGEPGTGKTQLAKAAAKELGRVFVRHTVDARTEARDLLWHFDAVGRLADAQLQGALGGEADVGNLSVQHYVHPRALWWALNGEGAYDQQKQNAQPEQDVPAERVQFQAGVVALIDEIDKADSEVPNGLLETLGEQQFRPTGCAAVTLSGEPPLIVITTNQERELPDAFLRRCLVLHLRLPEEREALIEHLVKRGKTHFGAEAHQLLQTAAGWLADDRAAAADAGYPLPGQAEYLDLIRSAIQLSDESRTADSWLEEVREFTLRKNAPPSV